MSADNEFELDDYADEEFDPDALDPDEAFLYREVPFPKNPQQAIEHLQLFSQSRERYALGWYVDYNREVLAELARFDRQVAEALVEGFKYRIELGDIQYLTHLGGLYYMGHIVEQDYNEARKLYERAAEKGDTQGQINLGYIWEYGRCGEQDLHKAYECYSVAAMLADAPEAWYKVGDLANRGVLGQRSVALAYKFWKKSYQIATDQDDVPICSQAAFRMAKALLEDHEAKLESRVSLMYLLNLLQEAERGLRWDIAHGASYYARRLEQTLEFQDEVRKLMARNPEDIDKRFIALR